MKRVLFVDDEPQILEGLRNMLRRQRRVWEMTFVTSGAEALEVLATHAQDVVVSDMRMPQMDGAELLSRVQQSHPDCVRIVLSGHAELEAALRAVPVAHQFLTKPCKAEVLEAVVERACNLHELVRDARLQEVVGKIERLPTVPRVYAALTAALAAPGTGVAEVAAIIEQDVSMAAKLLQLVNSSFFTRGAPITSIDAAVSRVGFEMVKNLVLTVEIFGTTVASTVPGLSVEDLQEHALLAGDLAKRIIPDRSKAGDAHTAGLLHDIGKLLLLAELPERLAGSLGRAREEGIPLHVAEAEESGVTHAEIGAYLLGLWGLPYPIVEAVAYHHAPHRIASPQPDLVMAVHVADALAYEAHQPAAADAEALAPPALDREYLAAAGVDDRIDEWMHIARDAAGATSFGGAR